MSETVPTTGGGYRLVAAALGAALMPLNSTMIAVAVPEIGEEFGSDPALVTQALVTSYLIAAVVLQSPGGKIGDLVGHGRMLVVGQVLVAVGALIGLLASTLWLLVVARVLMAAGGAALVPSTIALFRHALPPAKRGRAFGAFGAMMALSAAVGPLVGGELVRAFGWPSVFAANLPIIAVAAVLGILAGPVAARPSRTAPARFDWVGTSLLAAALTAIMVGLRPDGEHGLALLVVGAVLVVPFTLWERRSADPVVNFAVFRSMHFSAGTTLIAMQNLVMYSLLFEVAILADTLFDLTARGTGQLLLSMMLAMVVTSFVAGRLVDQLGARPIALAGSLAALVGIGGLAWIDLTAPGQVALPLVLLGVGLGLATPAAQTASMAAVQADLAGMAAGIGSTMRYLGGIVGVAVMSLLLDVDVTRSEVVSDHRRLMAVYAGALVVGLVCAALLPGRHSVGQPPKSSRRSARNSS